MQRPAGGNVKDLLRSIAWVPESLNARVFIDGEYVKDAAWEYTVPQRWAIGRRARDPDGRRRRRSRERRQGRIVAMIGDHCPCPRDVRRRLACSVLEAALFATAPIFRPCSAPSAYPAHLASAP